MLRDQETGCEPEQFLRRFPRAQPDVQLADQARAGGRRRERALRRHAHGSSASAAWARRNVTAWWCPAVTVSVSGAYPMSAATRRAESPGTRIPNVPAAVVLVSRGGDPSSTATTAPFIGFPLVASSTDPWTTSPAWAESEDDRPNPRPTTSTHDVRLARVAIMIFNQLRRPPPAAPKARAARASSAA